MKVQYGSIIYQGKTCEIWIDPRQSVDLLFQQNKFWISQKLASNLELLNEKYDEFCTKELTKIITKNINHLRTRKIKVKLDYTDGIKTFKKEEKLSVDDCPRRKPSPHQTAQLSCR